MRICCDDRRSNNQTNKSKCNEYIMHIGPPNCRRHLSGFRLAAVPPAGASVRTPPESECPLRSGQSTGIGKIPSYLESRLYRDAHLPGIAKCTEFRRTSLQSTYLCIIGTKIETLNTTKAHCERTSVTCSTSSVSSGQVTIGTPAAFERTARTLFKP